jgi:hypothetical protein
MLKVKILENQIICRSEKPKGTKRDSQNQLMLHTLLLL